MNVKKVLNFASWALFAVGVFFIISSSTRTDFILGIGMILLGIVLQSISFQYFKNDQLPQEQDSKEDLEDKEFLDEVMRDLSRAGWVLTSQSSNKTGFKRRRLTLLVEIVNGELVLSGTGVAEAEVDLDVLETPKTSTRHLN